MVSVLIEKGVYVMPLPPQTACRFSYITLMLVNVYYGEEFSANVGQRIYFV